MFRFICELQSGKIDIRSGPALHEIQTQKIAAAGLAGVDMLHGSIRCGETGQLFVIQIAARGAGHTHESPAMQTGRTVMPYFAALGDKKFRRIGMILQHSHVRFRTADRTVGPAPQFHRYSVQKRGPGRRHDRRPGGPQTQQQKLRRRAALLCCKADGSGVGVHQRPQGLLQPLLYRQKAPHPLYVVHRLQQDRR